jgi:uncharacterized membrane protein (UPF0127 family)
LRQVNIINRTRSLKQPLAAGFCESFWCKLRGLSWRRSLAEDRGLVLADKSESRVNSSIHMLGMMFPLTILWLDSNFKVVDVYHAKPWLSFAAPRKPARYVIECAASRHEDFQIGDQLAFETA